MGELFNSKSNLDILSFLSHRSNSNHTETLRLFLTVIHTYTQTYSHESRDVILNLNAIFLSQDGHRVSIDSTNDDYPAYPGTPPEKAGYLEWPIEGRSNLYVLGVVGYLLFNRRLPSFSEDGSLFMDMELDVPPMIRLILEKLLSWYPDDRYQTIEGLTHDLSICLSGLESSGEMVSFLLGQRDVSRQARFPNYLFGRHHEDELLRQLLEKSVYSTQLLFLGGYSGVGKTSLIRSFLKQEDNANLFIMSGKCDQFSAKPYAAFSGALLSLVDYMVANDDEGMKAAFLDCLHPNAQLLVDFLPEFKMVLGLDGSHHNVPLEMVKSRLRYVFAKVFQFISAHIGQTVLFLDDVQWSDDVTLSVIHDLLKENIPLLVMCAYRDNECMTPHVVKDFRRIFVAFETHFTDHHLSSLSKQDVEELLSQVFQNRLTHLSELTHFVYEKAKGNPYFTKELVLDVVKTGCVTFQDHSCEWLLSESQLKAGFVAQNVADLISNRIGYLDDDVKMVLCWASFLGYRFKVDDLVCVTNRSRTDTERVLGVAETKGFVVKSDEHHYDFLHDVIQRGFYKLVLDEEKDQRYLQIGQLLLADFKLKKREHDVPVEIIQYLNKGARSIQNTSDIKELIVLNKSAAERLKAKAAFHFALECYALIEQLMASHPEIVDKRVALDIAKDYAEIQYILGDFESADALVARVLDRSEDIALCAEILNVQVVAYHSVSQHKRAFDLSIQALKMLGMDIPDRISTWTFLVFGLWVEIQFLFRKRTFLSLKTAESALDIWILTFMIHAGLTAWFSGKSDKVMILILKALNWMFKNGQSAESAFVIIAYAVHHIDHDRIDDALNYFSESEVVTDRYASSLWSTRVRHVYGCFIAYWAHSYQYCFDYLDTVIDDCRKIGDDQSRMYSVINKLTMYIEIGIPLQRFKEELLMTRNENKREMGEAVERYNARGLFNHLKSFDGYLTCLEDGSDIASAFSHLEGEVCTPSDYDAYSAKFLNINLLYVFNEFDKARDILKILNSYFSDFKVRNYVSFYYFFSGLLSTNQRDFNTSLKKFKKWSKRNPANFESRYSLLKAENQKYKGKLRDALTLYDSAIIQSAQQNFHNITAIASERAYEVSCQINDMVKANYYLNQAIQSYSEWGAVAKVEQLKLKKPNLASTLMT